MANKVTNWIKQDVEGMIIIKVFFQTETLVYMHAHLLHDEYTQQTYSDQGSTLPDHPRPQVGTTSITLRL